MGGCIVLQMTTEVTGVAGNTLIVAGVTLGATLQGPVCRVVAGLASVRGMDLGPGGKRSLSRGMTPNAVCGVRGSGHIHRHLRTDVITVAMAVAVKVGRMTRRAGLVLTFTCRGTEQYARGVVVTGLTAQGSVGLTRTNKRCGCRVVTIKAEVHRSHRVGMLMVIEIADVTDGAACS